MKNTINNVQNAINNSAHNAKNWYNNHKDDLLVAAAIVGTVGTLAIVVGSTASKLAKAKANFASNFALLTPEDIEQINDAFVKLNVH